MWDIVKGTPNYKENFSRAFDEDKNSLRKLFNHPSWFKFEENRNIAVQTQRAKRYERLQTISENIYWSQASLKENIEKVNELFSNTLKSFKLLHGLVQNEMNRSVPDWKKINQQIKICSS